VSSDGGATWTDKPIPCTTKFGAGEDLVYYGATGSGANQTWYVYFAQNRRHTVTGWKTTQLMPVHAGQVCEGGISCTGGGQLY
jgi:hypothetical protein